MTRVGWLADQVPYIGGAELTQSEFRAAAPDGVQVVDCPPGKVDPDCQRFAIHNCVSYSLEDLQVIKDRPAVKYHNDVGPWLQPEVRELLDRHASAICCSPLQAEYMGLGDALLIPPPVALARFEAAAETARWDRTGAVCVANWRNLGKAPHRAAEWAAGNGGLDFFGDGPFAPPGSRPIPYDGMPALLSSYRTFVFLPSVIEPFGRLVAEAWAAGAELVINNLVGARYWIEECPEGLQNAAERFWEACLHGPWTPPR